MKTLAIILILIFSFIFQSSIKAQKYPSNFSQERIGTVYYPTAMVFTPDGRIFVTEKAGKVRVVKDDKVLSKNFLKINVSEQNERGLDGIVLDPDFLNNQYVYLYYTTSSAPIRNRISRFTASGDTALPGSEQVVLDLEPSLSAFHNGGGMAFGKDAKLYIGVGDDYTSSNAQNLNTYKGKVLRINTDGSAVKNNPFTGSAISERIWAYGFRNPFSLVADPISGKIHVNDVGENSWEEINDISQGGNNYGWPLREGMTSNPAYTNPIYTYQHGESDSNGCAITGGTFFHTIQSDYPAKYNGKYFFIDYCEDWINYIDLNGSNRATFATKIPGSNVSIIAGNDGKLYYFNLTDNGLYRINYSNEGKPVISLNPIGQSIAATQPVTFRVRATGANPLNYQWKKDGISIDGETSATYSIAETQPTDSGEYTVMVSNSIDSTTSESAILTITAANSKPKAKILKPSTDTVYKAGELIHFQGSAIDQEDGPLGPEKFTWLVNFHHDGHIHSGPFIPSGIDSGSFEIPITGETSADVFYRIRLVAEDSKGLKDTSSIDLTPLTSLVTINSDPEGFEFLLDGELLKAPFSMQSVIGMKRTIGTSTPQLFNNENYNFQSWDDNGNINHDIFVQEKDSIYTAVFRPESSINIQKLTKEYPIGINIYPNPNSGHFTINLSATDLLNPFISVEIHNILGESVSLNKYKTKSQLENILTISLDDNLPEGIYSVVMKNGSTMHTLKLILAK